MYFILLIITIIIIVIIIILTFTLIRHIDWYELELALCILCICFFFYDFCQHEIKHSNSNSKYDSPQIFDSPVNYYPYGLPLQMLHIRSKDD